jgi:hypothetical protein
MSLRRGDWNGLRILALQETSVARLGDRRAG